MSDDAIREALVHAMTSPGFRDATWDEVAQVGLDAVRPLIEADLRERLAAAIEARAAELDALTITHQDRTAATICQIRREEALHLVRLCRERP